MYRNKILSEIFLEVLERNGDKFAQEFVRKIRIYIKSPQCAELFNFLVVNAAGGRIPIKRSIVYDAIECLIKIYEQEIEDDKNISDENKERAKAQMKTSMYTYRDLLEMYISANYLIEQE